MSRGIAAIAVILWHWQHFAYVDGDKAGWFQRNQQPFYEVLVPFYEKGFLAVDYFFLLSGVVFFWLYSAQIGSGSLSAATFIVQRISRLYPLHLVTLIIVAILQYYFYLQTDQYFIYKFNDVYHFLLNIAFISSWGFERGFSFNAPIWSVSVEMFLYCAFFCFALTRRARPVICVAIAVAAYFVGRIIGGFDHSIFRGLTSFFMGGVTYVLIVKGGGSAVFRRFVYIGTFGLWALVIICFYVFDYAALVVALFGRSAEMALNAFPLFVLFPMTVSAIAMVEISGVGVFRRLAWFGDITYSSYLLHFPLQIVFVMTAQRAGWSLDLLFSPVAFGLYMAVLLPMSYCTFIGFERPAQNCIRRWFRGFIGDSRKPGR